MLVQLPCSSQRDQKNRYRDTRTETKFGLAEEERDGKNYDLAQDQQQGELSRWRKSGFHTLICAHSWAPAKHPEYAL
jgi:hypothetical protein